MVNRSSKKKSQKRYQALTVRRDSLIEKITVFERERGEAVILGGHATRLPASGVKRCVTAEISNGGE